MKDMKVKRAMAQTLLAYMLHCDVQNTEGDYDRMCEFTEKMLFAYEDYRTDEHDLYDTVQIEHDVHEMLNPLWEYYVVNLHDGYNVTVEDLDE